MKAIILIRIEHDNMENRNAVSESIVKTFVNEHGKSPYGNMAKWLAQQEPIRHYAGYDGQVYPQFKTKIEW